MEEKSEGIENEKSASYPAEGGAADTVGEEQAFSRQDFVTGVSTEQDLTMNGTGAVGIAAGRDMQLTDGGAFSIAVGRDLNLTDGGAFMINVKGNADVTDGGSVVTLCKEMNARDSNFGIVISKQTNLGEGSSVLLDTKQAVAFGAAVGAAFGAVFALLGWLLRRRR
ncbi:MAG: hypothetical protein EHM21_11020 [Chloroflexi bacterium]|nr:MAG: hypothetical protein EHM21_11020 [Chloroflexota bacterium]